MTATALAMRSAAETRLGHRVGIDPIEPVHVMENHDHSYHIWRAARVKDRVLVHIDAHHDMWWIDDNRSLTIANFICPAIKEHMVREVYWVVPDQTWASRAGCCAVRSHLKRIAKYYPQSTKLDWNKDRVSTTIAGARLIVCSLDSLPNLSEEVLLDIDTDYLVIPRVSFGESDKHPDLPWCWPERMLDKLRERGLRTDLATIVYSVEGGYTPLKWKYLGDEIALRLGHPGELASFKPYELIRAAALAEVLCDVGRARDCLRQAGDSAAACLHLAGLLADEDPSEARELYRRALSLDASYSTAYGSPGIQMYNAGQYDAAERDFRQTVSLDPQNAYAHLGVARVASHRKLWPDAEARFRSAIAFNPNLLDAYRGLARTLVKQGRVDEAIQAYEKSLQLALAGYKPLGETIATSPPEDRLLDPQHGRIHAKLARLYERNGRARRAIAGYRMALAGGYGAPWARFRLARLFLRDAQWTNSATEAGRGLRAIPSHSRAFVTRIVRKFTSSVDRLLR